MRANSVTKIAINNLSNGGPVKVRRNHNQAIIIIVIYPHLKKLFININSHSINSLTALQITRRPELLCGFVTNAENL